MAVTEIRKAKPSDIDEIEKFARDLFEDYSRQDFLKMMEDKLYRFTIAITEDVVSGFLILLLVDEKAEVIKVATNPKFYRRGIAKSLIDDGVEFVKNLGKVGMLLEVKQTNTPAKNLYEKLGFTEIFVRKNYYGGKIDASIQELIF